MYGPSPTTSAAIAIPSSSLGVMFEGVWVVFAAITILFIAISVWQLIRPAGNHPRP
jgi:predicted small integral membrane protein